MKSKKVVGQYRQGDVLLQPIPCIPKSAKKLVDKETRIVLAEGEVTGHYHVIKDRTHVDAYFKDDVLYLDVKEPAPLEHDEHGTIYVKPGQYEVKRQVEQWMDEVRQVMD